VCYACIRVLFISSVLNEILTIALFLVVIPDENIVTCHEFRTDLRDEIHVSARKNPESQILKTLLELAFCSVIPTSSGMSEPNAHDTHNPNALLTKPKSGVRVALEYTGIPTSWFSKRPKLPSRNWLIFISVTSSVVGYYIYDRRQCNQIRQSYVDRVKHFAEEPLNSLDVTRKVTVYGSRWPGDEDYDRSMKYFRKYVKVCLFCVWICYA
jgi:hypothetical protein